MLSVVCIHYNDPDMLWRCLQSVAQQSGSQTECIIVDNSSNFPKEKLTDLGVPFQYIDPGYNSGFARGVNAGLKAAQGDYVLLLNQDAVLPEKNILVSCIRRLQELPEKTILGVNLLDEGGQHQRSIWPHDPGIWKEWRSSAVYIRFMRHRQPEQQYREYVASLHRHSGWVHRINGAFLLFHRSLFDRDRLYWDEDFFLYGEDVEWAYRCHQKGWKFYHYAEAVVHHAGSASSSMTLTAKQSQVIVSDWLAMRKMKGRVYVAVLLLLTFFNRTLDLLLERIQVLWSGQTGQNAALDYARMQLALIRRFGWRLVFGAKISDSRSFEFNCYR